MATRGEVRLDVNTHEAGASMAAAQLKKVNVEVGTFSALNLNAAIGMLGQAAGAVGALWDMAESGEAANNIQMAFNRTVANSAVAMTNARRATAGFMDDTTIQKRVTALSRLNLGFKAQAIALRTIIKLSKLSGDAEETVARKVMGAINGRKASLKDYGIIIKDATNALEEMDKALSDVKLEDFQGSVGRLHNSWNNFWSEMEQQMANSADQASRLWTKWKRHTSVFAGLVIDISDFNDKQAQLAKITKEATAALSNQAVALTAVGRAFKKSLDAKKAAKRGPELTLGKSTSFGKGSVPATVAIRRSGGGGGRTRQRKDPLAAGLAGIDAAVESTGLEGDMAAQTAQLERQLEIQRKQLQIDIQRGTISEREAVAAKLDIERDQAKLDFQMKSLDHVKQKHAITLSEMEAQEQILAIVKAQSKAETKAQKKPSKTATEMSLENQLGLFQQTTQAAGQLGAKMAQNEQERAAIFAVMSILDATMASIRIIADLGVYGIPLAAVTMGLGIANAASYSAIAGTSAKTGNRGNAFSSGFRATAVGSQRPDTAGAGITNVFNAPVIGGTAQEIAAQLGEFDDSGGNRAGAA